MSIKELKFLYVTIQSIQGVKETEKQLQRSQAQLSASEDIARQLRMKEDDFTEAVNAKDSQLAVLRVRIQESDQELQNKRKQIEEYQLERERSVRAIGIYTS